MLKHLNIPTWTWTKLNLNLTESAVYACIYGFSVSKESKVKGYKGSIRQMERDLPLNASTISRVLQKLQNDNLVVLENGVYRCVAQSNKSVAECNKSVAECNKSVAECNKSVAECNSPHTPLYNNSLKINNNPKPSNPTDMDSVAGLEVDFFSLALFTEYYQLFPYRAKNDRIKQAAQTEFCSLSREKQQLIIDTLRQQIDNDEKLPDTSPLMYIRHFDKNAPPPDGEPVNYNNSSIPEGKFVQPAKYKGQWGMYCLADIIKYNLEIKQD